MILRLCRLWDLHSTERYANLLAREGWSDEELATFRKRCQELRVKLALSSETQVEDAITNAGTALVLVIILGAFLWPSLAPIARFFGW